MLELRDAGEQHLRLSYGGDVLNTLIYAQRAGARAGFATVTGDDHYGRWLRASWEWEGLNCELVRHQTAASPALYMIRNDDAGERSFHYWRDASPFVHLLESDDYINQLIDALSAAKWVYFSAISLAMLPESHREVLLSMLGQLRSKTRVAFDPNYRARLWPDVGSASCWVQRAYACATLVMPSLEDEISLRQQKVTPQQVIDELLTLGVEEVVVKDGILGSFVQAGGVITQVQAVPVAQVVDTTSAGDAFNGAYLAARMLKQDVVEAATSGAQLAAHVVQHPGAIAPHQTEDR